MKKLKQSLFMEASRYIKKHARPLERYIYEDYFHKPCGEKILNELKKYQNNDGGFGNGLEPDFKLPLSSPMATSVVFQHLIELDDYKEAIEMIIQGIKYFESVFVSERSGWFAAPQKVNEFPHAPWWHYNEKEGMTIIDRHWGNPSAEIIGYLYNYRDVVSKLDVQQLLEYTISYINSKYDFESEHEIYCFIRLYDIIPDRLSRKIEDKLKYAVQKLVCRDRKEWDKYVPQPVHFIDGPGSNTFGIEKELIEDNLDYLIDILEEKGRIEPSWEWGQYETEWEKSKEEWTGILTLKTLIKLDKFERIQK